MRVRIYSGQPVYPQYMDLNLTHWTQQISVMQTQSPMPAGLQTVYLHTYSWLFSIGLSTETLHLLGRVYSEAEREKLEKAVRSWYYFSVPALGLRLPSVVDDMGNEWEGLFGNLVFKKSGGKGDQWDFQLDFYVMVYTGLSNYLLNGFLINGLGHHCTCGFHYGLTTSYGRSLTAIGTYETGEAFSCAIGVPIGTTYHFRAWAKYGSEIGYGLDRTVTGT